MKIPAYIQKNRYGIYHFRRVIPADLRLVLGKREVTITLKTRDPKIAVQSAKFLSIQFDRMLTEAHMGKNKTIKTDYGYKIELPDGTKVTAEIDAKDIDSMKNANFSSEQILDSMKELKSAVTSLLTTKSTPQNSSVTSSISIFELIDKYKNDYQALEGKNIFSNKETAFRRLCELVGKDEPCTSIDIELAREIRDSIMKLPKNSKKFDGVHILKIIKINHKETIAPITVANHIDAYSDLFKWAKENRYYDDNNPFKGLAPKFTKGGTRDSFTSSDLEKIFNGDMFTKLSLNTHKPHHYWAPLISLFTGVRIAEIGALRNSDIKEITDADGKNPVWVFDINTHDGEDRLKTENSRRITPVHPKLIELGLVSYSEQQAADGNIRLFNYLKKDSKGSYGRWIGEDFTNYLKTIGIHVDRRKVFHSFRHTIATALERAGISDQRIELISGRSSSERKTTGRKHYITAPEAHHLLEDIKKMDFSKELKSVKPYFEMIENSADDDPN